MTYDIYSGKGHHWLRSCSIQKHYVTPCWFQGLYEQIFTKFLSEHNFFPEFTACEMTTTLFILRRINHVIDLPWHMGIHIAITNDNDLWRYDKTDDMAAGKSALWPGEESFNPFAQRATIWLWYQARTYCVGLGQDNSSRQNQTMLEWNLICINIWHHTMQWRYIK